MSNQILWQTIESDPAVFTELCERIGATEVGFEEVYSLDEESFQSFVMSNDVVGFIFLFKHDGSDTGKPATDNYPEDLYFANQIIADACASMAIMSILMNQADKTDIGPHLQNFRDLAIFCDPEVRGLLMSEFEILRVAHNSFSAPLAFDVKKTQDRKKAKDQFHFISYIPFANKVWELDGLKKGPADLGEISTEIPLPSDKQWTDAVRNEVASRIEKIMSGGSELRFTLLAMVKSPEALEFNKRTVLRSVQSLAMQVMDSKDTDEIEMKKKSFIEKLDTSNNWNKSQNELWNEWMGRAANFSSVEAAEITAAELAIELENIENSPRLIGYDQTREAWKKENERRRHDFLPFVLKCCELLAKDGKLRELVNSSKK